MRVEWSEIPREMAHSEAQLFRHKDGAKREVVREDAQVL